MSNLTDLLPAGAGGKQVDFVASGTIGNGVTVGLNSDGTVSAVLITDQSAGSEVVFESAESNFNSAVFDSNANKVVIAYQDGGNSLYGTAIVGTVSGSTISFGTPVVFESARADEISATFDSNSNKVVIGYSDRGNSFYGTAIVGTVSGTSISFGTAVVFKAATVEKIAATFDSNSNKVVLAYQDGGNVNAGTAVVGTVSGTSISFGTAVVYNSGITDNQSATFDSNLNKVVVAYRDQSNSNYGTAVVGTVSGTSISFGSEVVFNSANTTYKSAVFDSSSNKIIISYDSTGSEGRAIVGTVSGTSISFGTSVQFTNVSADWLSSAFDSSSNKVVVVASDNNANGTARVGTVSGTSISFEPDLVYNAAHSVYNTAVFDSNANKTVIAYRDIGNSSYGTAVVFQAQSTNAPDFIGISDAAISDTASGSVTIKGGISTNVTGLTPNALYYVQADGVLASGNIPYSISGASYDSVSFSIAGQDVTPAEMQFNDDGTKMYIMGYTDDIVFQYSLSSAYDMGTASYDSVNFDVTSQETEPTALAFNSDGTKMYIAGRVNDTVYQYTLATPFVVSSATYDSISFSVASQEGLVSSIAFKSDGTKMYVVGTGNSTVFQYTLATPFVVSSATYDSVSFSISSNGGEANPTGLTFSEDGTKMFVIGFSLDAVLSYSLSNAWDLSTASYDSVSFSVASQDTAPQSVVFNAAGNKFYIVGAAQGAVFQYSTTPASTTVLAGKALSSTSINLDYTT